MIMTPVARHITNDVRTEAAVRALSLRAEVTCDLNVDSTSIPIESP